MSLTPEQILIIAGHVKANSIRLASLRDDLIDHLCCAVEKNLETGKSFEEGLQDALVDLAPHGLYRIQTETDLLLNSRYMLTMKKFTYLVGSLSAMAMSFGWLLRILRMAELGNAVFAFGALGFVALFLPFLVINYFRDNIRKPMAYKLRFVFGVFSAIFIGIAFLAKIMHLPGADEVMWIGGILFTFGFLPFLFFTMYRKSVSPPNGDRQ